MEQVSIMDSAYPVKNLIRILQQAELGLSMLGGGNAFMSSHRFSYDFVAFIRTRGRKPDG
jgi:hypothetical protein